MVGGVFFGGLSGEWIFANWRDRLAKKFLVGGGGWFGCFFVCDVAAGIFSADSKCVIVESAELLRLVVEVVVVVDDRRVGQLSRPLGGDLWRQRQLLFRLRLALLVLLVGEGVLVPVLPWRQCLPRE